eukprot:CAMPEP_0197235130 /NCGR_PEP_ID=MMETSP1429-20130617/2636_1 /TAXON_ID=49237 /ORGANISM="Chaetoceros  sp., Strain UNC1202" /LENGTH=78 /DNA_ID=CAMNT_0042693651 /DNA_START=51 /DNA_END=287 /DNA_ORIENTATION=+
MSSGYGIRGGIGRCYPFFAEFKECLMNDETSEKGEVCMPHREDYFECLHHRKEHAMIRKIKEQVKINEKEAAGGGHGH